MNNFRVMSAACLLMVVSAQTLADGLPALKEDVDRRFNNVNSKEQQQDAAIARNAAGIAANATAIAANTAAINAISALSAYDYRNFGMAGNITGKTFALSGSFCGDTETRVYVRTPVATGTAVDMTRSWTAGGVSCHLRTFHNLATDKAYLLLGSAQYNPANGELMNSYTLDNPVVERTASMLPGGSFASAAMVTVVTPGQPDVSNGLFLENLIALGTENVSVPAGSYTACLKMYSKRNSSGFGAYDRFAWYCPGVGEVKITQYGTDGTTRVWELTGITTN